MPIDPSNVEWEEAPVAATTGPAPENIEWETAPQPAAPSWAPEGSEGIRGETAAFLRGVRKSLPFGQDIGAAAEAVRKGESFEQSKREQMARDVELQKQHPVATTAGEIGGFFVPGFGMAGRMSKAEQALATRLAPKIGETAARVVGAGGAGAGAGVISGLGSGVTPGERLGEAEKQAVFGGVGGSLFPAAGAAIRGVTGLGRPLTAAEEAAQRLKVDLPSYIGSESRLQKSLATAAGSVPVGGARIPQSAQTAIKQMGEAADTLHAGVSKLEAGTTAKDALTNWIKTRSTEAVDAAYDAVDRYVSKDIRTPLSNTLNTVQQLGRERLEAALPEESGAIRLVLEGATNPEGLNYFGIKRLRTEIGEKLKEGILPADMTRTELKNLYGALSEDLKSAAKNAGGQKGLQAFERANKLYNNVAQKRAELTKIVGLKGDVAPEAVFNRIVSMASERAGNVNRLVKARTSMSPAQWDDVTSGVLSSLGRDKEGAFSPERFITGYHTLSDVGRDVLFGPPGNPLRQSLDDLLQVSGKFKELSGFTNTSKTANVLAGIALLAEPFSALGTAATANVVARVLSRPRTAKAAANLAKSRTRQAYDAYLASIRAEMGQQPTEAPRAERASGGRIGKRDYPAKKLSSIERAARRALGGIAKDAEPIMDMPDEHVAHALRMAK